jgi:hypothetical protein
MRGFLDFTYDQHQFGNLALETHDISAPRLLIWRLLVSDPRRRDAGAKQARKYFCGDDLAELAPLHVETLRSVAAPRGR